MEAGKLEIVRVDFDLKHLLDGVVELLAPRAKEKAIAIGCHLTPEVPNALRGDPGRLRQVLLNLVGNSVKFTEKGGVELRVSLVERGEARARVKFEIVDSGIGIPEPLQAGLFAEFSQVDPSYTRRYGGTGLGLAISKKLTELMGGTIGFTSTYGKGSSFWFVVDLDIGEAPAKEAVAAPQARIAKRVAARPRASRTISPANSTATARVLLVEDSPVNQIVASAMLAKAVGSIESVANGKDALAAVAAKDYDLILMDVAMPEMDGVEATERIRALGGAKGAVPIIAISAHALESDRQRCLAAGMNDYVTKPIDRAELMAAVERWLGDKTGAKEERRARGSERGAELAVLDRSTLDQLAADTDPAVAAELVKTFVDETISRLDHIAHAADEGDFTTLEREAHSLKSSSGTFGALALQAHAKALEFACREGARERALLLVPQLKELVAAASAAMTRHFEKVR